MQVVAAGGLLPGTRQSDDTVACCLPKVTPDVNANSGIQRASYERAGAVSCALAEIAANRTPAIAPRVVRVVKRTLTRGRMAS